VHELDKCWRSVLASRPEPIVCVDLTGVTFIDEAGKACLAALHRLADCVTKAILDEIAQAEQLASGVLSNDDPTLVQTQDKTSE
jgi:anti-anti-sigma regulatory factor